VTASGPWGKLPDRGPESPLTLPIWMALAVMPGAEAVLPVVPVQALASAWGVKENEDAGATLGAAPLPEEPAAAAPEPEPAEPEPVDAAPDGPPAEELAPVASPGLPTPPSPWPEAPR